MFYLDHAAAAPVSSKALAAMLPYFSDQFFNPSSPYLPAAHLRKNYEFAKNQLAHTIGAKGADLIITSGATESINLAFTAARSLTSKNTAITPQDDPKTSQNALKSPEILILSTEHASVRESAAATGLKVTEAAVDKNGRINLADFQKKLSKNVCFISISLANNELGTIQPLAEISEMVKTERRRRLTGKNPLPLYLHSDASQALNLIDISVARLGVDLLTINSAKIGGPKGVGALYHSHDVKLHPLIHGGGQEAGLRSGTENVPGVIGFATAAEEAKKHLTYNRKKYENLRKILKTELKQAKVEPLFLGTEKHQLANFCPVSFPGLDAERLIYKLEEQEVYLSTGAACAASKGEKSHVLTAIGLSDAEIAGSLRISLGPLNTEENIKTAARLIRQAVDEEYRRLHE